MLGNRDGLMQRAVGIVASVQLREHERALLQRPHDDIGRCGQAGDGIRDRRVQQCEAGAEIAATEFLRQQDFGTEGQAIARTTGGFGPMRGCTQQRLEPCVQLLRRQ